MTMYGHTIHVPTFCSISLGRSTLSLYVSTMIVAKSMSRPSFQLSSIEKLAFPYEKLGIRSGSTSLALLCQYVMISGQLFFYLEKTKQNKKTFHKTSTFQGSI